MKYLPYYLGSLAITKTEVEVEFDVPEDATTTEVTFEFEGDAVEEADVDWVDDVATLTVASMKYGFDYTVGVFDDAVEIYEATFTFTQTSAASITTDAISNISEQVGNEVSITYTVEDTGGDPMQGLEVRVRAVDTDPTDDVVEIEEFLTTDEAGEITFSYVWVDEGVTHDIRARVMAFPTVQNNDVSVSWTLQPTNLITAESNNVTIGNGTYRTYTATFYDEDFNTLDDGETVYVELDGLTSHGTNTVIDDTEGDFAFDSGIIANATLGNGDGTATLVVTDNDDGATLIPTFYYGNATLGDADAIYTAGTVTFEEPEFSAADSSLELAEDEVADVAVDEDVTFVLNAVDQFGNPFIGDLEVDFIENVDNLGGTSPGAIEYDIALDAGTDTGQTTGTRALTIDDEGEVEITLHSGLDGEAATLVAWFEDDVAPTGYSAAKPQVVADEVTFTALTLSELTLEADDDVASTIGELVFFLELLDQNEEAMPTSGGTYDADLGFQILDSDGDLVDLRDTDNVANVQYDVDYDVESFDWTNADDYKDSNQAAVVQEATVNNESEVAVKVDLGASELVLAAGEYTFRAFIDGNKNGTLQGDEFSIEVPFTVEERAVSAGEFTAISAEDGASALEMDEGTYDALVDEVNFQAGAFTSGDITLASADDSDSLTVAGIQINIAWDDDSSGAHDATHITGVDGGATPPVASVAIDRTENAANAATAIAAALQAVVDDGGYASDGNLVDATIAADGDAVNISGIGQHVDASDANAFNFDITTSGNFDSTRQGENITTQVGDGEAEAQLHVNEGYIDLTYEIQDQDGNALDPDGDVTWTLTNDTDEDVVIVASDAQTETVASGETESITVAVSATTNVLSIMGDAGAEGSITVTAMVDGVETTEESYSVLYNVETVAQATNLNYTGTTVVAFEEHATLTNSKILVEYFGDYLLFDLENVFDSTIYFRINGATRTATAFFDALEPGDTLNLSNSTQADELTLDLVQ